LEQASLRSLRRFDAGKFTQPAQAWLRAGLLLTPPQFETFFFSIALRHPAEDGSA
jgi:hypothetical protein